MDFAMPLWLDFRASAVALDSEVRQGRGVVRQGEATKSVKNSSKSNRKRVKL
jgi:hypothetical protein